MGKNTKNRETVARLNTTSSLHFDTPVVDVLGRERDVLYRDEAKWQPDVVMIQVGGAPRTRSGIVITGAEHPAPAQMMPIPVWRIWLFGKKPGEESAAFCIPFAQAHERVPQRMIAKPTEEDPDAMQSVSIPEYEQRVAVAERERGGVVVQ